MDFYGKIIENIFYGKKNHKQILTDQKKNPVKKKFNQKKFHEKNIFF